MNLQTEPKRPQSLMVIAMATLLLAGCSTPTQIDKGPITASSFNFIRPSPARSGMSIAEKDQKVHGFIQDAITANLADRGLSRVDQGGDVTVAYLIVVGNNASTKSINDYFGYSEDGIALADEAFNAYNKRSGRDYFEAGTLLVDIIDNKTQKVVMRNYVVRPLNRNATDDARKKRIREAVDALLYDVRIKPRS